MASTYSLRYKGGERRPMPRTQNQVLLQRIGGGYFLQTSVVFFAYLVAGKLGQATTNIRSSNLGPVWPAYGIALAAILICGYRVWPGVAAGAILVAFFSPVSHLAALGQAAGATVAAMTGAFLLHRIANFHPSLSRLSDAMSLVAIGGFGSALLSASIGVSALYATHVQAYSGLGAAWMIYWLGDATGVLLVTPLVLRFTDFLKLRDRNRVAELAVLLVLLATTCFVIFGDLPSIPVKLHVMAFAVLPFIIWAAIRFGVGATALSILIVAGIATIETALGSGPFASNTTFINAVLLDVFFGVLSVSGLALAAVIVEREHAERERERVVSQQAAMEARLQAAHVLRLSEERWRLAAQAGKMYAYEWDVATDAVVRTGGVAGVLGAMGEAPSLTRQQLLARVHPDDRALFIASASERTPDNPDSQISYRMLRPDGSVIWLEKTAHAFFDEHGRMVRKIGIVADITERKAAEETISTMTRKLLEAQEQERARIARELHDDINQRLAMLALELEQLRENSPELTPGNRQRVEQLRDETAAISGDVQALSHDLHSSLLEYLGAVAGMKSWCKEFGERQGMQIDCRDEVRNTLPPDIGLCLFRVLQEALHNAAKHSGVKRIEVQLHEESGEIHLIVRDSGRGFDIEAARQGRGLGLTSMAERVRLVKGTIVVDSKPMGGTSLRIRIPFTPEQASQSATG